MFDELDDPAFPGADPGARAAVAARAGAIRRRRRAAWAGGGTSLALVVVAIVFTAGNGDPRGLHVVSETPTPTASGATGEPDVSETPDPSPEPPTASPAGPVPTRTAAPATTAPEPTPEETYDPDGWNQPDGEPGWSTGYGGCAQSRPLPSASEEPFEELTLELRLPSSSLRGGGDHVGTLVITNTGERYLRFSISEYDSHAVVSDDRGNVNGHPWSDAIAISRVELAPGQSVERNVSVTTWVCGDTSRHPRTALPAGRYTVGAPIHWSDRSVGVAATTQPGEPTAGPVIPTQEPSPEPSPAPEPSWGPPQSGHGTWVSPKVTVTVTE